jgi:sulfite dehydrogenase (quinone) subunit SoeA
VNPETVWTWNAVGKRRGAWMLKDGAPESEKAFLLNHAISEFLPGDADARRYSNSDPVTGQAAWFDLRVRVTKCAADEVGRAEPQFPILATPPGLTPAPDLLQFGAAFRRWREAREARQ